MNSDHENRFTQCASEYKQRQRSSAFDEIVEDNRFLQCVTEHRKYQSDHHYEDEKDNRFLLCYKEHKLFGDLPDSAVDNRFLRCAVLEKTTRSFSPPRLQQQQQQQQRIPYVSVNSWAEEWKKEQENRQQKSQPVAIPSRHRPPGLPSPLVRPRVKTMEEEFPSLPSSLSSLPKTPKWNPNPTPLREEVTLIPLPMPEAQYVSISLNGCHTSVRPVYSDTDTSYVPKQEYQVTKKVIGGSWSDRVKYSMQVAKDAEEDSDSDSEPEPEILLDDEEFLHTQNIVQYLHSE